MQALAKELTSLKKERDQGSTEAGRGRLVVPPHLVNVKLGNRQHVMIDGGKSFGTWTMTEILAKADLIPGIDRETCEKLEKEKASLAHLQHSELVWDVMYRYGEDVTKRKAQCTAEKLKLLKIDLVKRSLAMMAEVRQIRDLVKGKTFEESYDASDSFVLSLTIKEASDLPKMDVLNSIDSYCVVGVDNFQDEVYQTKVVSKNRNPVWDANFEWTLSMDTQLLTVALVDHDTITEDDLVGAV
jgi:hypothetical protein